MKVCLVGVGAIGGFIGARLGEAGWEVSAIARGATAQALKSRGLRLQLGERVVQTPVRVASSEDLGPQDLVVFAVKGPSAPEASAALPGLLGPDTILLPAMNGVPWWFFHRFGGPLDGQRVEAVDPGGVLSANAPPDQVVGCVVHASCSVIEPGFVRHGFGDELIVGEPAGGLTDRVVKVRDWLQAAGFKTTASPRIQMDIWFKLWGNMTMNPISALTRATCDRILDDPLVSRFSLDVMAEAAEVGARIGCAITQSGEARNAVTRKLGAFKTSMLQDLEAGRPLEVNALLEAPQEIARKVGVATPNLDALVGLTRMLGATVSTSRP